MENIRRVLLYLAGAIGAWLLISFGGAMFDSARATLWATSLLWGLLSFLIIAPALVLFTIPFGEESTSSEKSFVENDDGQQKNLSSESEEDWDEETSGSSAQVHS